jgi:Na+/alanine symporter
MKRTPRLALTICFAIAFFGGLATVALVAFVLVPLWAILTVVAWQWTRHRGEEMP